MNTSEENEEDDVGGEERWKTKGGRGLVFYAEPATKAISRQCSQLCKQME